MSDGGEFASLERGSVERPDLRIVVPSEAFGPLTFEVGDSSQYSSPYGVVSDSELVIPDNLGSRLDSIDSVRRSTYRPGVVHSFDAFMTDGSQYGVRVGLANEPVTDIAVSTGTALFTGHRGLNKRIMLNLMTAGFNVVSETTEQQWRGHRSIGASAVNHLALLPILEESFGFRERVSIDEGISRRSMIGMAVQFLSSEFFDREIIMGDYIVPCFNRGLVAEEAADHAKQPLDIVRGIGDHIRMLPVKHMLLYPKTFDGSARGLWSSFRYIPNLVGGDAGRYFRQSDPQANMYLGVFDGDAWSQADGWEHDVTTPVPRPNVVVDREDGGSHGDCARQDIFDKWLFRQMGIAAELVRVGGDTSKFKATNIYPDAEVA